MQLLVVEDDPKLVAALERGLVMEGYGVDVARDGDDGLAMASTQAYDAVILDLMLPGTDGLSVCARLRRLGKWWPVLILTARSAVDDRIRGLDGGADDYLVKPFDFGELLARLRVLVRRGPVAHTDVIRVADLTIDRSTRTVSRKGRAVELTARELAVLEVLARSPGRLVSRKDLVDAVWSAGQAGSANIADVYVGHLRRKLDDPRGRPLIRTIRGKGFLLEAC